MRRVQPSLLASFLAALVAVAVNAVAFALFSVPLLAEQAGSLVVRVMPLALFTATLRLLGVLARPLLYLGSTLALILAFATAGALVERVSRWDRRVTVPALFGVLAGALGLLAHNPGEGASGIALEAVLVTLSAILGVAGRDLIRRPEPAADPSGRRALLRTLFLSGIALSVVGIAYFALQRIGTALSLREGSRSLEEITPVGDFYVVSKNLGGDPVIAAGAWRLTLPDGKTVSYQELLALPSRRLELTLTCISNEVGGTLISNGIWLGVPVRDLLARAPGPAGARFLLIESADGYTESLPLAALSPDALLATHLNGEPLTPVHGFPARLIFPGRYGMKQPKWVTRLRLGAVDEPGFWERRGWTEEAIVKTMSRIDVPADGSLLPAGSVTFAGIAFAGDRGVSGVELSIDGGQWLQTALAAEFSPYAWRFWRLTTELAGGGHTARVRARDGTGALQSEATAPPLPNGAEGLHRIRLVVR